MLREISQYEWDSNRLKLSEEEKACFTLVVFFNTKRRLEIKYVFNEPWRFVLKVVPNMITQVKLHDEILQQEIAEIDDHIERHFYEPRMHRLIYGGRYRWHDDDNESLKYINKFKNIPRYSPKEAYLELDT